MAFPDPFSINNFAAVAKSFSRKSTTGAASDWIEVTSTATNKILLRIAHNLGGKPVVPGTKIERHLIQAKQVKYNATVGKDEELVVNLTILAPSTSTFSRAEIDDLVAFVKNGAQAATVNMDRLLRNES